MDSFNGNPIYYRDKDIGKTFNEWTILARVIGTRNVVCRCSCGNVKIVKKSNVTLGYSKSCGHTILRSSIQGKNFGEWVVLEDTGGTYVKCQCSCNKIKDVIDYNLINGISKSCGHGTNLEGNTFGYWSVIEDYLNGNALCRCICGKLHVNRKANLINGHTKSCGCMKGKLKSQTSIIRLAGRTFGSLYVLEDNGYGTITCKCKCGTIREYNKYSVTSGHTKSCGCMRNEYRYDSRFNNDRTDEQKLASSNEINLYNFIMNHFSYKPTLIELANELGLSYSRTVNIITDKTRKLIHYHPATSRLEKEIVTIVEDLINKDIRYNIRNVINPYELDIYIPELKIAIEFNGNYWHSIYFKDKKYHQTKSLKSLEKGIRLIHIYEYELSDLDKIKDILYKAIKTKDTNNCNYSIQRIKLSLDKDNIIDYITHGYKIINVIEPEHHIIMGTYVIYDAGCVILEKT